MRGEKDALRERVYMGVFKQAWRVNDYEWSFILNHVKGKTNELYNLKADPREKENLINENPRKADELELDLRRFVAGLK